MRFLVGDIGGTKTMLALFVKKGQKCLLERKERFSSHDFKGLEEIIAQFLKGEETIQKACFGIAGPVENGICQATNLPWVVDTNSLEQKLKTREVFLINDLMANAYGLNLLSSKDLYTLNPGALYKEGNRGLVSAGTGLGESPIFYKGGEYVPSPSEGGHSDFAPRNEVEIELFRYLKEKYGHVSYERVLSGQGLINLYHFLIDRGLEKEKVEVKRAMESEDPAKVISEFGLSHKCRACEKSLSWFASLYGAEAGNFALKVFSLGGLYIGGGIAPKILPILKKGEFMAAFIDKGRFKNLLCQVPVHIILEENTALLGSLYFINH